jgi:uncharacterized protein
MLTVISPAKNLDYASPLVTGRYTQPEFLDDAEELIEQLKLLAPEAIGDLMKLSEKLSILNANRYQSWQRPFTPDDARPAILAFNGDVYAGLDAKSLSEAEFSFAQRHLRILSGLYGLLKPLDLMQPYRLEMGTALVTDRGNNLYAFWGDKITQAVNKLLEQQDCSILVNLASSEYFKSIRLHRLNATVVTPQFKDEKNGRYKTISFFAKKARGMMAAYLIKNRIKSPEGLIGFDAAGYYFSEEESSESKPVFLRDEVARQNL